MSMFPKMCDAFSKSLKYIWNVSKRLNIKESLFIFNGVHMNDA